MSYYIVNKDGSRRVGTAFNHEDNVITALGGQQCAEHFMKKQKCMIEWQDDDDIIDQHLTPDQEQDLDMVAAHGYLEGAAS